MPTFTTMITRKHITAAVMGAVVCFGVLMMTVPASVQAQVRDVTNSELKLQLDEWMDELIVLKEVASSLVYKAADSSQQASLSVGYVSNVPTSSVRTVQQTIDLSRTELVMNIVPNAIPADNIAVNSYNRNTNGYILLEGDNEGKSAVTGNLRTAEGGLFTLKAQGIGKEIVIAEWGDTNYLVSEIPADDAATIPNSKYTRSRSEARLIMDGQPDTQYYLKYNIFIDASSDLLSGSDSADRIVQQIIETEGTTRNTPVMSMNLTTSGMFQFNKRTTEDHFETLATFPADKGAWHEFEYVFTTGRNGQVSVWHDGLNVVNEANLVLTQCSEEVVDCPFSVKTGIYRALNGLMGANKIYYKDIEIRQAVPPEPFSAADITSVISELVTFESAEDRTDYTKYTITLNNGTVETFNSYGGGAQPALMGKLDLMGYTGTLSQFNALYVPQGYYELRHIESVIAEKTSPNVTEYTIKLKDYVGGTQFIRKAYGAGWRHLPTERLRNTNYKGRIIDFKNIVERTQFDITDVTSIKSALKNNYTKYTIKLNDGVVHVTKTYAYDETGVRSVELTDLRKIGYTGSLSEFNAMYVPKGYYEARHIESVIGTLEDPTSGGPYNKFTITLKDYVGSGPHVIKTYGLGIQEIITGKLRDTNYKGLVSDVRDMVQQQ